jgi:hypothetical protein
LTDVQLQLIGDRMPELSRWADPDNTRFLRELTNFYLYRSKRSVKGGRQILELAKELAAVAVSMRELGADSIGEQGRLYQSLRRFMFFETRAVREYHMLDSLFKVVMSWLSEHRNDGEIARSQFVYQAQKRGWFDRSRQGKVDSSGTQTDSSDFASAAVDMFKIFFGTSDRDFENAARVLTGRLRCSGEDPKPEDRQGFITYRYSSRPGDIVRTFTVVTPPSDRYPYCYFKNFYSDDEGGTKVSDGVAVRLENATYLLGRINQGEAIKLFVLPSVAQSSSLLMGLLCTVSADGQPLMSRVVLERSKYSDSRASPEVRPCVISSSRAERDVSAKIRHRLRNYIEFDIDRKIYSIDQKSLISTSMMVELVGRMCEGKFKLGNISFNPASHDFYPFNQALLTYNGNSRERHYLSGAADNDPMP